MGGGGVTTTALAALDIALWDLAAKETGKSLVAYLGPCRERILAYASGINLNKTLPALVEQVEGWRAAGFKAFKVKIGKPEIEEDVERLTRVREAAGRLPVMVDANQGWDIGTAVRAINAVAHLSPHWIEEPLLVRRRRRSRPAATHGAQPDRDRRERLYAAAVQPLPRRRRLRLPAGRRRARRRHHALSRDRGARARLGRGRWHRTS